MPLFPRVFAVLVAVLLLGWPGLAMAEGLSKAECTLNADKSSMIVIASNSAGKAYNCMVNCRINVAGQRAFDVFECRFSLNANAAEKTVCERKGSGPGHFTKINSSRSICSPR